MSETCSDCGEDHVPSWADKKFGCKRDRLPNMKIRHGLKRTDCVDYREDLARFPGDPEAWTDGPTSVKKLWDKRQRQGWVRREEGFEGAFDAKPGDGVPKKSSEQRVREAYEKAKQSGFRSEGE